MKKIIMLLTILMFCFISTQSYCQTDVMDNHSKLSTHKKTKEDDKGIIMIIPADKYLDSIKTLKAEGYLIGSQVYNRKTDAWTVVVYPPSKSANAKTNNKCSQSEIPDGVRTGIYYTLDGQKVTIEDTWVGGVLIQRKANGKLVDLATHKIIK